MRRAFAISLLIVTLGCTTVAAPSNEVVGGFHAQAVMAACEGVCHSLDVYVVIMMRTADAGFAGDLPAESIDALGALGGIEFVTVEERNQLFTDDFLVDEGRGLIVEVGPVEMVSGDIAGVEVGVVTARDGGRGTFHRFQWDGTRWVPVGFEPRWVS